MQTIVIGIKKMIVTADALTEWQIVMATAMLAMLPPVLVVVVMQKLFVRGLVETVPLPRALPESFREHAVRIAEVWSEDLPRPPLIQVEAGAQVARGIVAAGSALMGMTLRVIPAARLPVTSGEIETIARIWEREALFSHSALLIEDIDRDGKRGTTKLPARSAQVTPDMEPEIRAAVR